MAPSPYLRQVPQTCDVSHCQRKRPRHCIHRPHAGNRRESRSQILQFARDPLYSKSNVFFNLDKARSVIRQAGFALLVEGQMDCISVFLSGIQNVMATSGTAFTQQHVAILRRHTSNIVVNFDGDTAGENAVEKFADKIAPLIEEGFSIRVVSLDSGLDPDALSESVVCKRTSMKLGTHTVWTFS